MSYSDILKAAKAAGRTFDEEVEQMALDTCIAHDKNKRYVYFCYTATDWDIEYYSKEYGILCYEPFRNCSHYDMKFWLRDIIAKIKEKNPKPPLLHDYLKKAIIHKASSKSTKRLSKIVEWGGKRLGLNIVKDVNQNFILKDYSFQCYFTKQFFHYYHDAHSVMVAGGVNKKFCIEAFEEHSFKDQRSGIYYSTADYTPIEINNQTLCKEAYFGLINYNESLKIWQWNEDEEDEEESEISDYHSNNRPWNKGVGQSLQFGCELEIESMDRAATSELAKNCDMFAERDGSLNQERGIEIVGKPMEFQQYKTDNPWKTFFVECNKQDTKGWDAGKDYGLHVSINRAALTHLHTGKLLVFINNNRELCEKVAGRKENNWARYRNKKINGHLEKNYADKYVVKQSDKYEALAVRSKHRLECRIFRSTLKYEGFLRAVEFCAAAVEFTRNASNLHLTDQHFKDWMKKPGKIKQYPNLAQKLELK